MSFLDFAGAHPVMAGIFAFMAWTLGLSITVALRTEPRKTTAKDLKP